MHENWVIPLKSREVQALSSGCLNDQADFTDVGLELKKNKVS